MKLHAVVPVKGLRQAKSRLSSHLDTGLREEMVLGLMQSVVEVLAGSGVVAEVAVVSPDSRVLQAAVAAGAVPLLNTDPLNEALDFARGWAMRSGAQRLLVVLGDLPLLTEEDVRAMAAHPGIVLAPDRHEAGTNALLVEPPDALSFAFGTGSFRRHLALAERTGLPLHIHRSETANLDVDGVEDLQALRGRSQLLPSWA